MVNRASANAANAAGRLAFCPECGGRIPGGHHGVIPGPRGPRRRGWKVASWCPYCEVYWIVCVSQGLRPPPSPRLRSHKNPEADDATAIPHRGPDGPPPGAHGLYQSPVRRASGPEVAIARRAVFCERRCREPVAT